MWNFSHVIAEKLIFFATEFNARIWNVCMGYCQAWEHRANASQIIFNFHNLLRKYLGHSLQRPSLRPIFAPLVTVDYFGNMESGPK